MDRAADFESARGGSTPPGAILTRESIAIWLGCASQMCRACHDCTPRATPGAAPWSAAELSQGDPGGVSRVPPMRSGGVVCRKMHCDAGTESRHVDLSLDGRRLRDSNAAQDPQRVGEDHPYVVGSPVAWPGKARL